MAMAEVIVGQADLLRSEKQRHTGICEFSLNNLAGLRVELLQRLMERAIAYGSRAYNQRAISDSFGDRGTFFSVFENLRRTHGRARLAERQFIGIDDPQVVRAEIRHGAGGRTDIQRIARANQNHNEVGKIGNWQGHHFTIRCAGDGLTLPGPKALSGDTPRTEVTYSADLNPGFSPRNCALCSSAAY